MGAAEYKPLPSHRSSSPADAKPASPTAHFLNAAAWVAFWIVCSVSIIIVNKHVITYSGFNFPISLALWHMFLGTLTSRAAVQALGMTDTIREQASPALYFQVGMIGVLFAATLVTGNAALRMLTVPTVQMLKVRPSAVCVAQQQEAAQATECEQPSVSKCAEAADCEQPSVSKSGTQHSIPCVAAVCQRTHQLTHTAPICTCVELSSLCAMHGMPCNAVLCCAGLWSRYHIFHGCDNGK